MPEDRDEPESPEYSRWKRLMAGLVQVKPEELAAKETEADSEPDPPPGRKAAT